tara:strand:- start:19 stop:606 length:588 start_codon:yes stop_codon:yes gene_type:complete
MDTIIIIGGGGHAKSCIDVIENENKFKIIGIIEKKSKLNIDIDYPIYSEDEDINFIKNKTNNILIGVGYIKNYQIRNELYLKYKSFGFKFPKIISPHSYVSKKVKIGDGTIVMHKSIINTNCTIGSNCIINTGSIIEHDVKIGNNCHISTSAVVNGNVSIGDNVFIGSNTTLVNSIDIESNIFLKSHKLIKNEKK